MIRCSKCGYERTEADSSTACPRCSAAYAELPIAATPEEQVICPKCGYVRTESDPRTACRTCGVVYIKLPIKVTPVESQKILQYYNSALDMSGSETEALKHSKSSTNLKRRWWDLELDIRWRMTLFVWAFWVLFGMPNGVADGRISTVFAYISCAAFPIVVGVALLIRFIRERKAIEKSPSSVLSISELRHIKVNEVNNIGSSIKHDVICPKCGYVRTEADQRTACRTCGLAYVMSPFEELQKANQYHHKPIPTLLDSRVLPDTPSLGREPKRRLSLNEKMTTLKIMAIGGSVSFLILFSITKLSSSPEKGSLSAMNGRWTDGSEIILVNAANGKLYAMTDKGLAIIFEPTSGAVQSVGEMDARTTTFLPIASNPLGKITDVMGLSLAEFSALAIRDSNEFSRLKVKMDNAAIEIKNGEKKDGYINGYGGKQLRAGMNFDVNELDVNKRVTFDHTFHLTFDRKLTNEEIGVLNEFAKDPAKGLKQNVAIDNVVAEFLSNTQKRAELFMQQKVALEKIAPEVWSIASKVTPLLYIQKPLERDESWSVLGFTVPPSISGVTKLSFNRHFAFEFTLPSETFGSSCILHTEPKEYRGVNLDWAIWLTGVNCQDNKVTEAAITDVFEAKQTMEPKFTVEKL